MNKVNLTQGQKDAANAFFEFLMTEDKTFAISGTAGVGKTFLMGYLANDVMKKYEQSCQMLDIKPEYDSAVFTATTNKAAEVLELALNKPVSTIHSFLGLKVKENFKTGKTTLERTNRYKKNYKLILFIDECSMIDKNLYAEIIEACENCKIVFVGDHAQMAPVNESVSAVYLDLPENNLAVLTEPVRNAGQPALVSLCEQLRDSVENAVFSPIIGADNAITYVGDEDMADLLDQHFTDLNPSCRVLCFTNSRVQFYNDYIRQEIRGLPPGLHKGDILVVAQAYSRGQTTLSDERELEVVRVGPVEDYTGFFGIIGENIPYREIEVCSPGASSGFLNIPVAEDPERVSMHIKQIARQKRWSDYFDLKNQFADLRDKAACTIYKAQGSTYDSVFVDLDNLGTSYDPEQVARMLFVACSRARKQVYLYGQLPGRYHNSRGKPQWTIQDTFTPSESFSSMEPQLDFVTDL